MSYPKNTGALFVPLFAIALVASLLAATAVSAAPKTIVGPDDKPGPTTTTTTTQPPWPDEPEPRLASFDLRSNSVSALAVVGYENAESVRVTWGDGNEDTVAIPQRGLAVKTQVHRNKRFLEHTYDDNNGDPYEVTVSVSVRGVDGSVDTASRTITISPFYVVNQGPAEFFALDHCETPAATYSEYEVTRTSTFPRSIDKSWSFKWETVVGNVGAKDLEESDYERGFTKADPPTVTYKVKEKDPVSDDNFGSLSFTLEPVIEYSVYELTFKDDKFLDLDCEAKISFTMESDLLVPGFETAPDLPQLESV